MKCYCRKVRSTEEINGRPSPLKIQSFQIAQTEHKWSSDELQNGSNDKEMIILKIK